MTEGTQAHVCRQRRSSPVDSVVPDASCKLYTQQSGAQWHNVSRRLRDDELHLREDAPASSLWQSSSEALTVIHGVRQFPSSRVAAIRSTVSPG